MGDTSVIIQGGRCQKVKISGGAIRRVTLDSSTIAKINDNRPKDVVQQRDTPVNVTERNTVVRTGGGMGVQGPPGGADLHYRHQQAIPASVWVVQHHLGKYPAVSVADSGGAWVIGDVRHDTINQCTLTFAGAFSGQAFFN